MAEGRSRAEWGRTSSLLAVLANCHRDAKRRPAPYTPADFDPHEARKPARKMEAGEKVGICVLKQVFVKKHRHQKRRQERTGGRD